MRLFSSRLQLRQQPVIGVKVGVAHARHAPFRQVHLGLLSSGPLERFVGHQSKTRSAFLASGRQGAIDRVAESPTLGGLVDVFCMPIRCTYHAAAPRGGGTRLWQSDSPTGE
jgi:hypothetical protein